MTISLTVLREETNGRGSTAAARRQPHGDPPGRGPVARSRAARTTTAEVRFDAGSRALYATDGSNYRQVPIGVVVPRTIDDVVATVAAARKHGAPVLSRGGGTSLAGQCCNVAVVMDFSKYLHHVVRIDPETASSAPCSPAACSTPSGTPPPERRA